MKNTHLIGVFSVFLFVAGVSGAANNSRSPDAGIDAAYPPVPLKEILEAVSKKSGKTFLVDARVSPTVVVGQLDATEVAYSSLLSILRNNGLAAVSGDGVSSIVPVAVVRQYSLPVLFDDDVSIHDEEWVTRVVRLENAPARSMVPIMRPLLPKSGHLSANEMSNTIIIVDRYANVRRVIELMQSLDSLTPSQTE